MWIPKRILWRNVLGRPRLTDDGLPSTEIPGIIAAHQGYRIVAQEQYHAPTCQLGTMWIWANLCNDRLLGMLAQTLGDHDSVVDHCEDALAF